MANRTNRRLRNIQAEQQPHVDLGTIVEALAPFVAGMAETVGLAAQPRQDEEGRRIPGDVRAAVAGLELISRHLGGTGASRGSQLLDLIRQLRQRERLETGDPDRDDPGTP